MSPLNCEQAILRVLEVRGSVVVDKQTAEKLREMVGPDIQEKPHGDKIVFAKVRS